MLLQSLRLAVAALVLGAASLVTVDARLSVGEYFRPSGRHVSGFPGTHATYTRSPCPALNTLANHGHLPRNGRGLTTEKLHTAVMHVLNVDRARADALTSGLNDAFGEVFTLADLSTHNFIEHDVSLVRADLSADFDPAHIDAELADDLLSRANAQGFLGIDEVAQALRDRVEWCLDEKGDQCEFGPQQVAITFSEAAGLLQVFGANGNATIHVEDAKSFLVLERIPHGWTKSPTPVTLVELTALADTIQTAAGVEIVEDAR